LLQCAPIARGRFVPKLPHAITELDHGTKNLVSVQQLAQLLARPLVEQLRMPKEQLRYFRPFG
jgi:hypothetical protein